MKRRVICFLEEMAETLRSRIGWGEHDIRLVPVNLVPANPDLKGWRYVPVSVWRLMAAWIESCWHPATRSV